MEKGTFFYFKGHYYKYLFHVFGDRILSQKLGALTTIIILRVRDERRLQELLVDLERGFL